MKESAFGKKNIEQIIDVRGKESLSHALRIQSSCASSCRSEASTEVAEPAIQKPEKMTRYKVYYVKEEIISAHSYVAAQSAIDHLRLKVTFKMDGQTSCVRDGVSKVEKL